MGRSTANREGRGAAELLEEAPEVVTVTIVLSGQNVVAVMVDDRLCSYHGILSK